LPRLPQDDLINACPRSPRLWRAEAFCKRFGLRLPILLAPMAGACPPSLSGAVASAGGLGACGALLMQPEAILKLAADLRAASNGPFQINLWIPDPPPQRSPDREARSTDMRGEIVLE
jgi:nitronate monooxygenase